MSWLEVIPTTNCIFGRENSCFLDKRVYEEMWEYMEEQLIIPRLPNGSIVMKVDLDDRHPVAAGSYLHGRCCVAHPAFFVPVRSPAALQQDGDPDRRATVHGMRGLRLRGAMAGAGGMAGAGARSGSMVQQDGKGHFTQQGRGPFIVVSSRC